MISETQTKVNRNQAISTNSARNL